MHSTPLAPTTSTWASRLTAMVLAAALAAGPAAGLDDHVEGGEDAVAPRDEAAAKRPWRFFAMPLFSWRPDDGLGFGGVVALSYAPEGFAPYRDQLRLRVFLSTELVQRHELRYEKIDAFALPLRLRASIGWASTRSATYCGLGGASVCDEAEAAAAATKARLGGATQARDDFERRYHRVRYMEPYAEVESRWRLVPSPWLVEAYATTRAAYHMPGDLQHPSPYAGSLYAQHHPDGEKGLYIVPQLGMLLDARKVEAQPDRGFVLEASVRGASSHAGSAASFAGVFGSAAVYLPLPGPLPVVLATRVTADALFGDPPTTELGRTGGLATRPAFGGPWLGRGVRESRFIGDLKIIPQGEVRVALWSDQLLRWHVEVGGAGFVDAGWVFARGIDDEHALRPLWGAGTGLRILIDRRLVLRLDVATSPFEDAPGSIYANIGNAV